MLRNLKLQREPRFKHPAFYRLFSKKLSPPYFHRFEQAQDLFITQMRASAADSRWNHLVIFMRWSSRFDWQAHNEHCSWHCLYETSTISFTCRRAYAFCISLSGTERQVTFEHQPSRPFQESVQPSRPFPRIHVYYVNAFKVYCKTLT